MGVPTRIPKAKVSDWKPHIALQTCFEDLSHYISKGELKGRKLDNGAIELSFEDKGHLTYTATGSDICTALMNLWFKVYG